MSLWVALFRALRLRCPACGQTAIFQPWSFRMPQECSQCRLSLQSESGFYLGAIYVNYGVTAVAILATYAVMTFAMGASAKTKLGVCAAIAVILPVFMFRHARSLWLALDAYFDPSAHL